MAGTKPGHDGVDGQCQRTLVSGRLRIAIPMLDACSIHRRQAMRAIADVRARDTPSAMIPAPCDIRRAGRDRGLGVGREATGGIGWKPGINT